MLFGHLIKLVVEDLTQNIFTLIAIATLIAALATLIAILIIALRGELGECNEKCASFYNQECLPYD